MVNISAAMVAKLRQKTGLPLMECKNALVEANGDLDSAEEVLRVKLGSKAAKLSQRPTSEGGLFIARRSDSAIMLEVNCETDFVAKDTIFKEFGQLAAERILEDRDSNLEDLRRESIAKLGENIVIKRFEVLNELETFGVYKHSDKIAAMVNIRGGDEDVARDLAIHIVSFKPRYATEKDVPEDVIEKERRVAQKQSEGKPQVVRDKMIEGRLRKFYEDNTLMKQSFIKNDKIDVGKFLEDSGAELKGFVCLMVGMEEE